MPRKTTVTVLMTFQVPRGVSFNDLRNYIITELESAGGQRHPSDPLFESLSNIHVSKPITVWRDPSFKRTNVLSLVKNN